MNAIEKLPARIPVFTKKRKHCDNYHFSKNSNSDCVRNYHTKNSVIDLFLFIFEFEF